MIIQKIRDALMEGDQNGTYLSEKNKQLIEELEAELYPIKKEKEHAIQLKIVMVEDKDKLEQIVNEFLNNVDLDIYSLKFDIRDIYNVEKSTLKTFFIAYIKFLDLSLV